LPPLSSFGVPEMKKSEMVYIEQIVLWKVPELDAQIQIFEKVFLKAKKINKWDWPSVNL
jgi:hypothetical protein